MSARKPRIPKHRKRKDGRGVVTLDGRDVYTGKFGTEEAEQEYDRLIAEWLAGGRQLIPRKSGAPTVAELVVAYLTFAKSYYVKSGKPTNQFDRASRALGFVTNLYSEIPASDFGPAKLKAVRGQMERARRARKNGPGKPWTRKFINTSIGCIVRAWKWAVSEEIIAEEVYRALSVLPGLRKGKTSAPESKPVLPVPETDIEATLPELSAVVRAAVQVQLWTGMRPSEVLVMRPCDIDQAAYEVEGVKVWSYTPYTHKLEHVEDRDRVVLIGPKAQEILAPWLRRQPEQHCFRPVEALAERGEGAAKRKVKAPGEVYDKDTYYHAIQRAIRRANAFARKVADRSGRKFEPGHVFVRPWCPYRLRHNAGTRLKREYGWEVARILLGHRHLDTTRIYAEDELDDAARAIAEAG